MEHYVEQRPWGQFETLAVFPAGAGDACVKIITVLPGKRLSYQSHRQRTEHWIFVQGRGRVVLEGAESEVFPGSRIDIPVTAKHRADNLAGEENLVFVEVSRGIFDEQDIERHEDDFGRAAKP